MTAIKYPLVVFAAAGLLLAGCPKSTPTSAQAPVDAAVDRGAATSPSPGAPKDAAACVDAWIAERGLNTYGDPPDTMYMGGSPLFDERTGTRTDRLDYILNKHPEVKERCGIEAPAPPEHGPATK